MDGKILEFILAAVFGGLGTKLLDRMLNNRKYAADVRRVDVESDKITSEQWKVLYNELRQVVMDQKQTLIEQKLEIDKLRVQCDQLTIDNMKLVQQFDFIKAINNTP